MHVVMCIYYVDMHVGMHACCKVHMHVACILYVHMHVDMHIVCAYAC